MEKVTVLTAVYNAEKYLRQCLDSLKNQTLTDCQFICIDDHSEDNSLSILREYASADSRFLILTMDRNVGQAVARNEGLKHASGEYIAMLDADDWFANDTLELAYNALKQHDADAAVLRLMQVYEGNDIVEYQINSEAESWNGIDAFTLSLDWSIHGLYVVKASIHKQYPFDTTCRLYSDDNTTRLHYLNSNLIVRCDGQYFYRKHSQSMTNACSIRRFDHMLANLSMKRFLDHEVESGNNRIPKSVLSLYEKNRWFNVIGCYGYYYQHRKSFSPEERKEIDKTFSVVLQSIDSSLLPLSLKMKPGYIPIKKYVVFSFLENVFFAIRSVVKGK